MANYYDSIENLISALEDDLNNAFSEGGKGDRIIKEKYKEKAIESYDKYSPQYPEASRYRTGRSGSFVEEENVQVRVSTSNGVVEYELENTTTSESDGTRIDQYIEEGVKGVPAKKVYEEMQDELDGGLAEEIIMEALADWF